MTPSLLHPALLDRYGKLPLPRYTSYPPANLWGDRDESLAKTVLSSLGSRPLSLYVHVPFCRKLCLYCGCNMTVTRRTETIDKYLDSLAFLSIDGLYRAVGEPRRIRAQPQYCDACFTGDYPTSLTDQDEAEVRDQLELLSERVS